MYSIVKPRPYSVIKMRPETIDLTKSSWSMIVRQLGWWSHLDTEGRLGEGGACDEMELQGCQARGTAVTH